jgi:alpha-tubulin suppressor-like RCC1 family protein
MDCSEIIGVNQENRNMGSTTKIIIGARVPNRKRMAAGLQRGGVLMTIWFTAATMLAVPYARADVVYDWGSGELGNGTTTNSSSPIAVSSLSSGVTAIAAGALHSLAVQNGGVYAWGYNGDGQLGDGTTTLRSSPVAVIGLSSGVTSVAAGDNHSLAVRNGGVWAWGYNDVGQLGNGTTTNSSTPVAVSGLSSGVTAIAAGKFNGLAVQNGQVWAWGFNNDGNLGDGTKTDHLTPEQIDPTDLKNIIAVAAEYNSSYALSSDGSIWDWGYNADGELGLGNTTSPYLTPRTCCPPAATPSPPLTPMLLATTPWQC